MDLAAFLAALRAREATLVVDGDQLRLRAPRGAVTDADRALIVEQKPAIIRYLQASEPGDRDASSPDRAAIPAGRPLAGPASLEAEGLGPRQVQALRNRASRAAPDQPGDRPGCEPTGQRGVGSTRPGSAGPSSYKSCKSGNAPSGAISAISPNIARIRRWRKLWRDRLRSMHGQVVGSVTIGGREYPYRAWDGDGLDGDFIALDTETPVVVGDEIPDLALVAVSAGDQHRLIHPEFLPDFLWRHRRRHFIAFNAAFDYWVIHRFLSVGGHVITLRFWERVVEENRLHDPMLLDQLVGLARTDAHPVPRDLAAVARQYAGLELDKDDPYRRRYAEIMGADWYSVDPGYFNYAIKDPIATLAAYRVLAVEARRLMEAHGHDPSRCG